MTKEQVKAFRSQIEQLERVANDISRTLSVIRMFDDNRIMPAYNDHESFLLEAFALMETGFTVTAMANRDVVIQLLKNKDLPEALSWIKANSTMLNSTRRQIVDLIGPTRPIVEQMLAKAKAGPEEKKEKPFEHASRCSICGEIHSLNDYTQN